MRQSDLRCQLVGRNVSSSLSTLEDVKTLQFNIHFSGEWGVVVGKVVENGCGGKHLREKTIDV